MQLDGRVKTDERRKWKRTIVPLRSGTSILAKEVRQGKTRGTLEEQYLKMLAHSHKIVASIQTAILSKDDDLVVKRKGLLRVHVSRMNAIGDELRRQGRFIAG